MAQQKTASDLNPASDYYFESNQGLRQSSIRGQTPNKINPNAINKGRLTVESINSRYGRPILLVEEPAKNKQSEEQRDLAREYEPYKSNNSAYQPQESVPNNYNLENVFDNQDVQDLKSAPTLPKIAAKSTGVLQNHMKTFYQHFGSPIYSNNEQASKAQT